MAGFEREKSLRLGRMDRSRKRSIDPRIRRLVEALNRLPDFYTTSSCSGRTMLIRVPESGKKHESEWLFVTHNKVNLRQLKKGLERLPREPVWLKKEGMILHVCCRTLGAASWLVESAVKSGFRRSGIAAASRRLMVEITDTERIELPVAKEGRLIVGDDYLRIVAGLANKKHERTGGKIAVFYKRIKKREKKE